MKWYCAYVLHARPFKETSLIVDLFTQELGRIHLVAKGAKRPKSKIRGLLRPFCPVLITLGGKGELRTLYNIESNGRAFYLKGNGLLSGLYVNELLTRLLAKGDPHPALFSLYQGVLQALEENSNIAVNLRLFEKALLKDIGYELPLNKHSIEEEKKYEFDPQTGPVETHEEFGILGRTLLELGQGAFSCKQTLQEAKQVLRGALGVYLGAKPLVSRELLR